MRYLPLLCVLGILHCSPETKRAPISEPDAAAPAPVDTDSDPLDGTDPPPNVSDEIDGVAGEEEEIPPPAPPAYIAGCQSLFAARVVEKAREDDASFPEDCDATLTQPVGRLSTSGNPLCLAGETANACRSRLYAAPPDVQTELDAACHTAIGCLRHKWIAQCKNGTDENCSEPEAVCTDGMRPAAQIERATGGVSHKWVFHLGGEGQPCSGESCWFMYRYARDMNEVAFERALTTLHPDYLTMSTVAGTGITAGIGAALNPFAGFNRVKLERCTDIASDALESVMIGDGVGPTVEAAFPGVAPQATRTSNVPVWHKGDAVWLALFHQLTTTAGRDLDGDDNPDVPSLANADEIVIAGSSDASMWLVFAADHLAEELRAIAPSVTVRVVVDGYFEPSFDNMGRYQSAAPSDYDLMQPSGECRLPDNADGLDNEACSRATYIEGSGNYARSIYARGTKLDASCEAMHGVRSPICADKMHTLFHHLETPVFVVADQEDPTISNGILFADDPSYLWPTPLVYRSALLPQIRDLERSFASDLREEGAGTPSQLTLLMRKQRRNHQGWNSANHVHLSDNVKMLWKMTRCDSLGAIEEQLTLADTIVKWTTDTLGTSFIYEDAAADNGWVTGDVCRNPE